MSGPRRVLVFGAAAVVVLVALAVLLIALGPGGDDGGSAATTTSVAPAAAGQPGAPGVGDPYFPELGNGGYDVAHYDLALTWRADQGVLDGVATIQATATQALSRFDLDLSGLTVSKIEVDGHRARWTRQDRELVITPAKVLRDAAAFTTVITYSGKPATMDEATDLYDVGWHTHGREAYVVGEPSGAETWFPANDHPVDKATFTFHVTVPSDEVAVANGVLIDKVPGGTTTTWSYDEADPMATYLAQVAIGDFALVDGGTQDGVVIRHALHRSIEAAARDTVSRTPEMLRLLADVYGPYPFAAYGVVAVDVPLGFALETQTLTLVGSDIGGGGRASDVILVHELAHQWVGDAVSPATWKDIWLNEGFATYSEWLWLERTGGPPAAKSARTRVGNRLDLPPGDPGRDELFDDTVYDRGARTLQALRETIGDAPFFELLKQWVSDHRGSVASSQDFIALAKQVSGRTDLDPLFQRWLYDKQLPTS